MASTEDQLEEHVQKYLNLLIGPLYKSYEAQKSAVAELQKIGANHLFPLLIPKLNSPFLLVRMQASRAILSVDTEKGIELILPFINDSDPEFRYDICGLMHDFGNSRVITALIDLMQSDTDPQIRGTAAFALGGIGDSQAIPALTKTMKSDHESDMHGHSPSSCAKLAIDEIHEKIMSDHQKIA